MSATDTYVCPAGERLKRRNYHPVRQAYEYLIHSSRQCDQCKLRPQCTRAKKGRSLKRFVDHELIRQARAQSQSLAARRDRQRRKHLMEGSFADAANNHHFKRARWRRLWRQSIQDLLIAAIQNVRILIAKGGNPPQGTAQAAEGSIAPKNRFWTWFRRTFGLQQMLLCNFSPSFSCS